MYISPLMVSVILVNRVGCDCEKTNKMIGTLTSNTRGRAGGRFSVLAALLLVAFIVSGCATRPPADDPAAVAEFDQINDPGEPAMRAIFELNRGLDSAILKPAAAIYRKTPAPLQRGVHNFLNNLRSPVIFVNDVLQGEIQRAGTTLVRFIINSTVGLLGIMDQASNMGLEFHNEDFGQTLAVWSLPEGPYIMLPIFGPSNPRDAIGMAVDFLLDPFNMWTSNTNNEWATWTRTGVRGVDLRARRFDAIADLEKSSLDFYAAIRSLYRQHRKDEISNGRQSANMAAPGISQNMDFPSLDSLDLSQAE